MVWAFFKLHEAAISLHLQSLHSVLVPSPWNFRCSLSDVFLRVLPLLPNTSGIGTTATHRGCSSSEFGAGCRSYTTRARQCLVFVTCCSLIWLGAQDGAESQIQISGQTWILCFSYQTSSWFGKVVLSPAHAMRRTPVICWKRGCSCCEKLPAGKPGFESLLWLTMAAAGGLGATGTRSDSSAEEEKEWCKEKLPGAECSFVPFLGATVL